MTDAPALTSTHWRRSFTHFTLSASLQFLSFMRYAITTDGDLMKGGADHTSLDDAINLLEMSWTQLLLLLEQSHLHPPGQSFRFIQEHNTAEATRLLTGRCLTCNALGSWHSLSWQALHIKVEPVSSCRAEGATSQILTYEIDAFCERRRHTRHRVIREGVSVEDLTCGNTLEKTGKPRQSATHHRVESAGQPHSRSHSTNSKRHMEKARTRHTANNACERSVEN